MIDRVVRAGSDARLAGAAATYTEMLLQVARDYPGIPDPRTLRIHEIVWFYNGLRPELKRHTKPKPQPTPPRSRGRRK